MLTTDDHQCILVLQFLGQMYAHNNDDNFWKEDTKKAFSTFRSAYLDNGETYFSEMQPLVRQSLKLTLVSGAVQDDLRKGVLLHKVLSNQVEMSQ